MATLLLVSPPNDVSETSAEIPYSNFPRGMTNQRHYPDLGSDASSVWNFCACFSEVIWRGNQQWRRQMSAVFSGQNLGSVMMTRRQNGILRSFLRRHLAGKTAVAWSLNVDCFSSYHRPRQHLFDLKTFANKQRTVWHFSEHLSSILRSQSGKGLLKKEGRAFRNIGKKYNPDSNISLASFVQCFHLLLIRSFITIRSFFL